MDSEQFRLDVLKPHQEAMMRTAWRLLRDSDDAADALQEALAELWRRRESVVRHPNPRAYILRTTASHAFNVLRARTRRKARFEPLSEETPSREKSPLENATQEELGEQVMSVIQTLPQRQAEAVYLRIVEELDYSEIAVAMQCEEATVRVHVGRGRQALRDRLSALREPKKEVCHERS